MKKEEAAGVVGGDNKVEEGVEAKLSSSNVEREISATDEFTCKPAPHQGKDTVSGVK